MNYLGHLSQSDPLFGYLSADILPQLGIKGTRSDFRVFKIWASNQVYLYEERFSQAQIVAKFFESISYRSAEAAHGRMEREFKNLFQKLTALAYFLATLHNETAAGDRVDSSRDCVYFVHVVDQLEKRQHIARNEAQELYRREEHWRKKEFRWEDNHVPVHGEGMDFKHTGGQHVTPSSSTWYP